MRIPLHAVVMCTDGAAGRCSHVIVDPAVLKVTHLVVGPDERLPRPPVPHLAVEESEHSIVLKTPHLVLEQNQDPAAPKVPHLMIEENERQATLSVPHLVVEEDESWRAEHLVPFDRVADATVQGISLDCTQQELAAMDDFVQRNYLRVSVPDYHNSPELWLVSGQVLEEARLVPLDEERIPPNTVAMDHSTRVEATDGEVGRLGELVVEPGSGCITYLVLHADHVWDPKDGAVPAAQIDRLGGGAVYLKLDKQSVERLPAVVMGNSS